MKRTIELGLFYSQSGSYALISQACRKGALAAFDKVNADPTLDFTLRAIERDPKGNIDLYAPLCEEIFKTSSAKHVLGCVTSWSRKEVIPVLERAGGSLWYTVPYEGFEASDHVIYTHACPNQHLIPLLDWALPTFGEQVFLTGSNYIWGWEMNRLAREIITWRGGTILGERYLPIGSKDVGRIIDEIKATRPSFIMNNLIGESSYEFLAEFRILCETDHYFKSAKPPILSCNMTECELPVLGENAEGLISVGPYFRGAIGWPGTGEFSSSHEAASFFAVTQLAHLLDEVPGADQNQISESLATHKSASCAIDHAHHHTSLPVLIAQVVNGAFSMLKSCGVTAADPYLTRSAPAKVQPINLRVVK